MMHFFCEERGDETRTQQQQQQQQQHTEQNEDDVCSIKCDDNNDIIIRITLKNLPNIPWNLHSLTRPCTRRSRSRLRIKSQTCNRPRFSQLRFPSPFFSKTHPARLVRVSCSVFALSYRTRFVTNKIRAFLRRHPRWRLNTGRKYVPL